VGADIRVVLIAVIAGALMVFVVVLADILGLVVRMRVERRHIFLRGAHVALGALLFVDASAAFARSWDDLDTTFPLFATIKQSDPDFYVKIKEVLDGSSSVEELQSSDRMLALGAMSMAYIARLAPHTPDDLVIALLNANVNQMRYLLERYPDAWGAISLGEDLKFAPGAIGKEGIVPAYLLHNTFSVMDKILKSQVAEEQHTLTGDEIRQLMSHVISILQTTMHISPETFRNALTGRADRTTTCQVNTEMVSQVGQLPAAQAAAIYRTILSQSSR